MSWGTDIIFVAIIIHCLKALLLDFMLVFILYLIKLLGRRVGTSNAETIEMKFQFLKDYISF